MPKLLHLADLHLDSPFKNLSYTRSVRLRALQREVGIPATLGVCGVKAEDYRKVLPHMIDSAKNDACTKTNPRPVTDADIVKILTPIAKF